MTRRGDELNEVLKELRREHREITAPESLEARLRAAARGAERATGPVAMPRAPVVSFWNWRWGWAMAAVVLLGVGLMIWDMGRRSQAPVQQARVETNSNRAPVEAAQEVAVTDASPAVPDLSQDAVRSAERRRRAEGVTAFMEVPGSEGLPAPMESSIVRVRMAKGDLRQYGFDVPPAATGEMIHADLYLGEDGLPRAIRLVR
jgi:hypothetical protein